MGLLNLLKRAPKDPTERFWAWFEKNKEDVAVLLSDRKRGMAAYERLTTEIQRVHESIMPEVTGDGDENNVLVISAGGIREAVPAVIALAEAAPRLVGWRIERFRSPRLEGTTINYQGLEVDPGSIQVATRFDEKEPLIHVGLVIPGYQEEDKRYLAVAFLYLDHTIGEYNTIMHVGRVNLFASNPLPAGTGLTGLAQLRETIETHFY